MTTIYNCSEVDPFVILRKRSLHRDSSTEKIVSEIIEAVRTRGDEALLESARRFDAPGLPSILVTQQEIEAAEVEDKVLEAIRTSASRVRAFHQMQAKVLFGERIYGWWKTPDLSTDSQRGGLGLGQRFRPLTSAGVYVPGGNATYPSSVIMNAIPAQCAEVKNVFVTTPARQNGTLAPAVLVALREVGIQKAFKVGGAAAIAALALGTESISRVDKVVGPGNRFVNEAKRQLWGQVGLDGYAGPSEVAVLADDHANATFAAADLLTQIEHAPDNAGFLVTLSRAKADEILAEAERLMTGQPREAAMRAALKNESMVFIAKDLAQAVEIVNAIAPEHLTLAVEKPETVVDSIQNAGCVLLGEWTPESAGDFCLGPSHTLPTAGAARFGSPVNVLDFVKVQSVSRLDFATLEPLIPVIEAFGEFEEFPIHGHGATVRRK